MKMYILILDDVPLGQAMTAAAHASLACYLKFQGREEIAQWLSGPFKKVVCKVDSDTFARACAAADHVLLTESALGGREVAAAFCPREEWPKMFQFLTLYR